MALHKEDIILDSKEFTGDVTMSEVLYRMRQLRGELQVERPESGEEGLVDIYEEELDLGETLDALLSGKIILLSTRDNDKSKDRLVRFKNTRNGIVSQISTPTTLMEEFVGGAKYWTLYDIGINILSLYPTYVFDPERYKTGNKYNVGAMVEYLNPQGEADIAVILKIQMDVESGRFYYTLSGEYENLFFEEEIANVITMG